MSLIFYPTCVFLDCMLVSLIWEKIRTFSLRRPLMMAAPQCGPGRGVSTCVSPEAVTVESRCLRPVRSRSWAWSLCRSVSCRLLAAPCWSSQKWVTLAWNSLSQTMGWESPTGQGVYKIKIIFIIIIMRYLVSLSHKCEKFIDMVSDATLELVFKKQPTVEFWCSVKD